MKLLTPPQIESSWALFLDLDGTLLDIAATPAGVAAPKSLCVALEQVHDWLDGALAIVSGRTLQDIDRLLHPLKLPSASEHGTLIRLPSGAISRAQDLHPLPRDWIETLTAKADESNGVLIEEKSHSIAIHFRLAPHRADEVRDLVTSLVGRDPARFEVLAAKMAFEIRSKDISKAHAVRSFMKVSPFHGRFPVFVGDDVTDFDGMAAARSLGGIGLEVGALFGDRPADVRHWLERTAAALQQS